MGNIKTNRGERRVSDANLTEDESIQESILGKVRPAGVAGIEHIMPEPKFINSPSERVIKKKNSYIVLGLDRNASTKSGFGGQKSKNSSAIDLVVGRASSYTKPGEKPKGSPTKNIAVNPNFFSDAARVYISQQSNIDEYFGLAPVAGQSSTGRSGVGIKADCVRIIGRNDIKIVTGKAHAEGGEKGEPNSAGGTVEGAGTISFIAGNYNEGHSVTKLNFLNKIAGKIPIKDEEEVETLQPVSKGDNLAQCLEEIISMVEDLASIVMENSNGIRELSGATGTHFHDYGGGFGPTTPSSIVGAKLIPSYIKSLKKIMENLNCSYNGAVLRLNYLRSFSPLYINSRHVFTS